MKPQVSQHIEKPVMVVALTGCDLVRSEVEKYDWDINIMVAISQAESRCDPQRVGDDYVIGGIYAPSCGVMQVRTLPGRPDCESLKDVAINIEAAYTIYQNQGLRAWSVYSNGQYLNYL